MNAVARDHIPNNNANSIKPYPHQESAIKDALKEFKTADRATVIMPCGTGKTLVCLWIAERLKARTVVVFVPSLALIHQTAMEWAKVATKPLRLMAICSDHTVALDEDGIIVEKNEFWFPVLSDTTEITDFLNGPINSKGMKVVFCTYQSSFTLSEAIGNCTFDLGIFDEAHRTAVKGESYFSAPLFDEYVAINKRLFATATPKQYVLNKKDSQDEFASILSMDNEEHYGKHCHVLSFRKAIEAGIISDYKIIFPAVTSNMVAQEMQIRGNTDLPDNAVYNAAMQIALKKAIQKTLVSKVITFHARVKGAEQFAGSLKQNKVISDCHIYHINGKQTSSTRKVVMNEFENKTKSLITNARCLTEGIDAPSVDMVAIFSNKKSKIDIIQAIGRALRKHPGKQCGYIMVPVFVDAAAGETYEEALAKPESQLLFELLLALEQHDELLCEAIRTCKFNEGYIDSNSYELLDKFFDTTSQKYLSSDKFRKALTITIIDKLGSNWDKMVGCLLKFKEQHGHCNVPKGFKVNRVLANWVSTVRKTKRKNKLSNEKIKELDKLGFDWEPANSFWKKRIAELKEFKKQHGHCNVPNGFKNNPILSNWVGTVRRTKKSNQLSNEKTEELDKLDFDWDPTNTTWEQWIIKLEKFKKQHGHCNVPNKFKGNATLASWVSNVRYLKKNKQLTEKRIKKLDKLGFVWEPTEQLWQQRVIELKAFKKQYGHCLVPREFNDNPVLARWVNNVRNSKKNKTLSNEKNKELDKLGFVWEPYDTAWQQRIAELKKFKKQYGHCTVPIKFKDAPTLGIWVNNVRRLKKKGQLTNEKTKELDKLDFIWEPLDAIWQQRIIELKAFKKQYGHCIVPIKFGNNPVLARWINTIRNAKKNRQLSNEKIKELDKLDFAWEPYEITWQQRITELKKFKKQYGHCLVPRDFNNNHAFSNWVCTVRKTKRNNKLSNEKIKGLDKLGFVWEPYDTAWQQRIAELKKFKKQYGHCNVSQGFKDNPALGLWVNTNRQLNKKGKLTEEKIKKLNKIGFCWLIK